MLLSILHHTPLLVEKIFVFLSFMDLMALHDVCIEMRDILRDYSPERIQMGELHTPIDVHLQKLNSRKIFW